MVRFLTILFFVLLYSCTPNKRIVITQASYKNVSFTLTRIGGLALPPDTLAHFLYDSTKFIEGVDVTINKLKRRDKICLSILKDSAWVIFQGGDLHDKDIIDFKWDHTNGKVIFINHKRISRKELRQHRNW